MTERLPLQPGDVVYGATVNAREVTLAHTTVLRRTPRLLQFTEYSSAVAFRGRGFPRVQVRLDAESEFDLARTPEEAVDQLAERLRGDIAEAERHLDLLRQDYGAVQAWRVARGSHA